MVHLGPRDYNQGHVGPIPSCPWDTFMEEYSGLGVGGMMQGWGHYSGERGAPVAGRNGEQCRCVPSEYCRASPPSKATIYPMGLHICLEAVQSVFSDASSHHDLGTFIVLLMDVLGQGRDSVLGVLQLHIHQQGFGYLVIETLQGREVQLQN